MPYTELRHWGILGMKWGVRRYQNKDGSLTAAGRRRYDVGPAKTTTETVTKKTNGKKEKTPTIIQDTKPKTKTESEPKPKPKTREEEMQEYIKTRQLEKTYNKLKKEEEGPSSYEQAKKSLDEAAKMVDQARKQNAEYIKKHTFKEKFDLSSMTDQDLRDRINRANLEKQYSDLFAKDQVQISKGRQFLTSVLDYAGPLIATAGTAVSLAVMIQQYKGNKK